VERRYVRERIKRLKADIEDVRRHRERARLERKSVPLPQIALVGYTNVGKSTLLNALTGKAREVYADDKLFATLDPTTRRVKLPDGRAVLFTDTVGFIQKLPTELIAAFRATLEEVSQASLLLHVVDAAAPDYDEQEKTVLDVIKSLEADRLPILTAYNKSDKLTAAQQRLIAGKDRYVISSQTGSGLMELLKAIETKLDEVLTEVTFEIPHTKNALTALVYQTAHILEQQPTETGTRFHVRIDPGNWRKLSHDLGQ
jgi:GTP-binding protein HflX